MTERFRAIARQSAYLVGHPSTFLALVLISLFWFVGGFIFGFTSDYQLYYNTSVSAITLWLVALLQSSQNGDTTALHLKLDELLRAVEGARTSLVDLEHQPHDHLEAAQREM